MSVAVADLDGLRVPVSSAQRLERSDPARNRRALLDAAAELIAESGPAAFSMGELARRAGVGKGTARRSYGGWPPRAQRWP